MTIILHNPENSLVREDTEDVLTLPILSPMLAVTSTAHSPCITHILFSTSTDFKYHDSLFLPSEAIRESTFFVQETKLLS